MVLIFFPITSKYEKSLKGPKVAMWATGTSRTAGWWAQPRLSSLSLWLTLWLSLWLTSLIIVDCHHSHYGHLGCCHQCHDCPKPIIFVAIVICGKNDQTFSGFNGVCSRSNVKAVDAVGDQSLLRSRWGFMKELRTAIYLNTLQWWRYKRRTETPDTRIPHGATTPAEMVPDQAETVTM